MLIAIIMEDGGVVTECMAGSGQVYVLPLNSFSYSYILIGFNSVHQKLQVLSKRWGKIMEKRAGRNRMCQGKEKRREYEIQSIIKRKNRGKCEYRHQSSNFTVS